MGFKYNGIQDTRWVCETNETKYLKKKNDDTENYAILYDIYFLSSDNYKRKAFFWFQKS